MRDRMIGGDKAPDTAPSLAVIAVIRLREHVLYCPGILVSWNRLAKRMSNQEYVRYPANDATWGQVDHKASPEIVKRSTATLPVPLTSLIGREQEIAAVCTLLARPSVRILTLTGTGGVGKTRLALAVAAEVQQNFPDGVYFISLEHLRDADLVVPTMVQALGLQTNNRPSLETLQAELHERRQLLVLDNFEAVVASGPRLLELLAACPRLKLLVTSREALRIRGEREFVVQPLALPDPQHQPTGESLSRYGAVALFLERAREVQPTLQLTASTAPLITEICRRLDGLPLALELAAARLKVLSLSALLERLERRLHILTGGPRDLPTRQQTLRQTIAWSYDLLSSEEKRLFRLLAAFVNGCALEAAEAVYSALGGERELVLDGVTSLLDKHLLYQSNRIQGEHPPRLLMHETVREFSLEALAANQELEAAQQCHAEYYLRLTEEAEPYLEGAGQAIWLDRLEREHANLRAALQWALEQQAGEVALRLGNALFRFWEGHRHLREGRTFLERALAISQSAPPDVRARSLFVTGALSLLQGDYAHGAALGQEAVALQRQLGDAHQLMWSLYLLGANAWVVGDLVAARSYAEEAQAVASPSDDKVMRAYLLDLLGQIALDQSEDVRARALLEEGLMLHREAGDTRGILGALFFLERVHLARGEVAQARAYGEEQLMLSRAIGMPVSIAGALCFLGRIALEEGNVARAGDLFGENVALLREMNDNLPFAVFLQEIGVTFAALGRLEEAAQFWGAAEALCAAAGVPLPPDERTFVERARPAVQSQLGQKAFAAAWAEGSAMTTEQALTAALNSLTRQSRTQTRKRASSSGARQQLPSSVAASGLTAREVEVLLLVARGLTDAQVAEALVISPRTVNAHLRSIYGKLGVTSRHAATLLAIERHLI